MKTIILIPMKIIITMIGSGELGYAAAAKRGVPEVHLDTLTIDAHNLSFDKNGNKKIIVTNGSKIISTDRVKKDIISPLLVPITSPIISDDVAASTNLKMSIVTPTSVTATATLSSESKTQTHIASKSLPLPLSQNEKSAPIVVLSESIPVEFTESITFGNFETPIAYESE